MEKSTSYRIVLADDHTVLAGGLASLLNKHEDLEVVDVANDGEKALESIHLHKPDMVILDINMPKLSGLDVALALKKAKSKIKILILSMHDKEGYIDHALEIGVDGYLLKSASVEEIYTAINRIRQDKLHYSSDVTDKLLSKFQTNPDTEEKIKVSLTETNILNLLSYGNTVDEISTKLKISTHSVTFYKRSLFAKFNVNNVPHLIRKAIEGGFIMADQ